MRLLENNNYGDSVYICDKCKSKQLFNKEYCIECKKFKDKNREKIKSLHKHN